MKTQISLITYTIALVLALMAITSVAQQIEPLPMLQEPIVMWTGTLDDIPAGWQLCDGSNGTPDLTDRFVVGMYDDLELGETGGAHEVQLSFYHLPSHHHSLTTYAGGKHMHRYYDNWYYREWKYAPYYNLYLYPTFHNLEFNDYLTDAAGSHFHSGTTHDTGSHSPFDNRPAYYRVAFITRTRSFAPILNPRAKSDNSTCLVTKGSIVMWSSLSALIPEGWSLCDGSNGTPDLRDRFVLGVNEGEDPGEIAGANYIQLTATSLPAHNHTFQTDAGGVHTHEHSDLASYYEGEDIDYGGLLYYGAIGVHDVVTVPDQTEPGGTHNHTGYTAMAGEGEFVDNRPVYHRLPYIMMTSDKESRSNAPIPPGAITLWYGESTTVPYGWQLCDGANGTPDLRDRFIMGGDFPGETGGFDEMVLTEDTLPPHHHYFVTSSDGEHQHGFEDHMNAISNVWYNLLYYYQVGTNLVGEYYHLASMEGEHAHTGMTAYTGDAHPYDNRPAYYKMAFIMRLF